MDKRKFLKVAGVIAAGSVVFPYSSCNPPVNNENSAEDTNSPGNAGFTLPPLAYAFDALEPNIDALTMEIHHDKHHGGYVSKLNAALESSPFKGKSLDDILSGISDSDTALRNNGGGHYNHSLFWKTLSPKPGKLSGDLESAINAAFGNFDTFKEQFSAASKSVFGSGWAWLCKGNDNKLFITTTPNQDNPLMTKITDKPGHPLLGLDVWEHAYYLKYQNKRADYIANFFNLIDWSFVGSRLG